MKIASPKQILINIRDRTRIDIEAGIARQQGGETGPSRRFNAYVHSRLQNCVSFDDYILGGIDDRAVEWMRKGPDELVPGSRRKLRVEVQRDDVTYVLEEGRISRSSPGTGRPGSAGND